MAHCTVCGHEGAYIGYASVECPNIKCKFFSELQLREWSSSNNSSSPVTQTAPAQQLTFPFMQSNQDAESNDDGIAYGWVTHHHDFGDC